MVVVGICCVCHPWPVGACDGTAIIAGHPLTSTYGLQAERLPGQDNSSRSLHTDCSTQPSAGLAITSRFRSGQICDDTLLLNTHTEDTIRESFQSDIATISVQSIAGRRCCVRLWLPKLCPNLIQNQFNIGRQLLATNTTISEPKLLQRVCKPFMALGAVLVADLIQRQSERHLNSKLFANQMIV